MFLSVSGREIRSRCVIEDHFLGGCREKNVPPIDNTFELLKSQGGVGKLKPPIRYSSCRLICAC